MKRLIYQVYVGKRTKLYNTCTASVKEYCNKHGIDYYQQTVPKLRIKPDIFLTNRSRESYEKHGGFLPIYEKENAFDYFDRYDQICIIDADIWIRPNSPNIFESLNPNVDFAGVVEREMPITEKYAQKIINYSQMQYGPLHSNSSDFKPNKLGFEFYNMGMMLMNKSIVEKMKAPNARAFIERPEFKGFVDGLGAWKWSTDQTLLNYWIKKDRVVEQHLDWRWNALYKGVTDSQVKEANFVHFFLKDLLPNRGEDVERLMEGVV